MTFFKDASEAIGDFCWKLYFEGDLKLKANCLSCVGYLELAVTFLRRWRLLLRITDA